MSERMTPGEAGRQAARDLKAAGWRITPDQAERAARIIADGIRHESPATQEVA